MAAGRLRFFSAREFQGLALDFLTSSYFQERELVFPGRNKQAE
jgi:hypothetical protein